MKIQVFFDNLPLVLYWQRKIEQVNLVAHVDVPERRPFLLTKKYPPEAWTKQLI